MAAQFGGGKFGTLLVDETGEHDREKCLEKQLANVTAERDILKHKVDGGRGLWRTHHSILRQCVGCGRWFRATAPNHGSDCDLCEACSRDGSEA